MALVVVFVAWAAADRSSPADLVVTGLAAGALAWRRTNPPVALAVTAGALAVGTLAAGIGTGAFLPTIIAIYSAISVGERGLGAAVAAGAAIVLPAVSIVRGAHWDEAVVIAPVAFLALAVAVGLWVQSRRATLAATRERAQRAEETRELEAARAVAEERLRIARELHDVLGHHVAIINVHAGVAEQLLTTRPEAALEALHHVQDATGSVLSELATLVEVLRDPGEAAELAPAPGLDSLPALVADVRRSGLDLTVTIDGEWPARLAPLVDLIAYRVIQESLTNARKHGTGEAVLVLTTTPANLTIEVTSPVRPGAPRDGSSGDGEATDGGRTTGGHGLVGLRERALSVGGSFEAVREGLTFRTRTLLPVLTIDAAGPPSAGPSLGADPDPHSDRIAP